jgi:hypothetical protein
MDFLEAACDRKRHYPYHQLHVARKHARILHDKWHHGYEVTWCKACHAAWVVNSTPDKVTKGGRR